MTARLTIQHADIPRFTQAGAIEARTGQSDSRRVLRLAQSESAAMLPAVHAVGVHKVLDDRPILRDLTFDVPAGCYAALLGANGAGKTTLLRLLSTLTTPTRGELEIFGRNSRRQGALIRAGIGLIGHQSMLYRDLSALENLVFFGRLHDLSEPGVRAMDLLDFVGLVDRAHDPVKTFSRGMVQRVSIARALLHEPRLLLADEPFAGLDAPSVDTVERLMAQLNEQGMAVLLANHDVRQSLRLAERVLVLRKGRLALDAAASELTVEQVLREIEQR